jgi:putative SOS response-associated peptidase YedK
MMQRARSAPVIVQVAYGAAADVHDRMPAFVPEALLAEWINGTPANAARMLATMETPPLAHYPVSPRVNSARSEGGDLIEPAA